MSAARDAEEFVAPAGRTAAEPQPGAPDSTGAADAMPGAAAAGVGAEPRDVLDTDSAGGLIIRGGVLRFASYATIVVLSLVPALLLTRYLGTVGFGRYTTVISLVTVVSLVTDVGMANLGTREFAIREGADRTAMMRDLLGLRVALTLVGVVFAMVFALCAGYDAALLAGTLLASLSTVALVFQHTYSIPLAAELRLGVLSLMEVVRQLLTAVAVIALIAVGAGILPLLSVPLAMYLLLVPVTAKLARGKITLGMELHPRRWLALLRPTVAYSLATMVGAIYVYTAQILTSLAASAHQSGLFSLSFRVYTVAVTIPMLLVSGAVPLLARAERDDRERLAYALQRIFEVSLILGVAAAVGILAGAPFIVEVVGGPKYAGSVPVLRIQGIALAASFMVAGWGFALLTIKRYRALLTVNAIALTTSCALTLALATTHGATGAAFATLCGECILLVGYPLALFTRNPALRPRLAVLPKVALAAAPALVLTLTLDLPSVVLIVLALGVYALVILLTRATPEEIVELIPRPRRRGAAAL